MRSLFKEDIAGLDMNDGQLVASRFSVRDGQQVLDRLAVGEYDPELSPDRLASEIRTFWKKNRMPTRTVRTCLHSRSLIVRCFRYKNLSQEELAQVLSLEAEEALQQPPDRISLDWQLNREANGIPAQQGPELSGTLVAAPRQTIERHLKLIQSAGLYAVQVEVGYCSLNSLYAFVTNEKPEASVCLVNLAERTADIVMRSGNNSYPRVLFSAENRWEENTEYLLENIQNALLYHHLKAGQPPMQKIILTGRIPKPDTFPGHLSKKAALPVEVMDPLSDPRLAAVDNFPDHLKHGDLITGIGLGIRRATAL